MPKPSSSALAEPVIEMEAPSQRLRWLETALLALAAVFLALHFVHLRADFPNYSFWKDWSKFTDEGWYGDAAIRFYQTGHWNAPGDFNPAAALPVWPAMLVVLFRFTGVSLVAARALTVGVFGGALVCCYLLLRMWSGGKRRGSLAAACTVALLAASPFCFVFTRIAILEPLLILLMLAALLAASAAGRSAGRARTGWVIAVGLLLPAMVLTKTTAVFLFPSILWTVWASTGYRPRTFLRISGSAGGIAALGWGAYYGLVVRPRYLIDYRYLFEANTYTGFEWKTLGKLLSDTVYHGIWIGETLFALAVVAMLATLVAIFAKGLKTQPMQVTMLLWILGYGAFLAYHANLQPRYYLVVAVPLTALAVLALEPLFVAAAHPARRDARSNIDAFLLRGVAAIAGAVLLLVALNAGRQTLGFVLHPEYTWVNAAAQVKQAVDQEAARSGHSKMVLSISGADLSLMTGLPSICDDFGTMTLTDRVAAYKPGWFATWNEVEDDKMDALTPTYRLVRVAAIPAFDDPDRNLLILYRLDPGGTPGRAHAPKRRRSLFALKSQRKMIMNTPGAEQLQH